MRMSAAGRAKLKTREGERLKAYRDSVGIWTIGVGHTSMAGPPKVTPGLTITKKQSDEILGRDLAKFENAVNNAVLVPVSQDMFDAMVSLAFNIGETGFKRSTIVKRLNKGDFEGAAEAFKMWNKPPEIMGRRLSEYKQFKGGIKKLPPPPDIEPPQEAPLPPRRPDEEPVTPPAPEAGFFMRMRKWLGGLFGSKKTTAGVGVLTASASTGQDTVTGLLSSVGEQSETLKEAVSPLINYGQIFAWIFGVLSLASFCWLAWSLVKGKKKDGE
jgi:lysozyme